MTVTEALAPLAEALEADGYELIAEQTADRSARVEVRATPDACADCLVPREVFAGILRTRLGDTLTGSWDVDVGYPADEAG